MLTRRSWGRVSVLAFLGVFVGTTGSGRGQPQGGEPQVKVSVTNQTGGPVGLFQGETALGVIQNGATGTAALAVGRILTVRDANRKDLAHYSTFAPGDVSIRIGPASAPGTAPAPKSALTDAEIADLVALHNRVRKEVGVGPVTWSPELATFAQAWADELARTGTFKHRPREAGPWQQKYGENIAYLQGEGADAVVVKGAEMWYAEKKDYTPGTPIPADFSTFKAGHYTQMVWRDSTTLGAGKATILTGDLKGARVLVGNYKPPGNMIGQTPYQPKK